MSPVATKLPVEGSKISAVFGVEFPSPAPPAINTRPSASRVAVCPLRAAVMLPVAVNVPVDGSYNSAPARFTILLPGAFTTGDQDFAILKQCSRVERARRRHVARRSERTGQLRQNRGCQP